MVTHSVPGSLQGIAIEANGSEVLVAAVAAPGRPDLGAVAQGDVVRSQMTA